MLNFDSVDICIIIHAVSHSLELSGKIKDRMIEFRSLNNLSVYLDRLIKGRFGLK